MYYIAMLNSLAVPSIVDNIAIDLVHHHEWTVFMITRLAQYTHNIVQCFYVGGREHIITLCMQAVCRLRAY